MGAAPRLSDAANREIETLVRQAQRGDREAFSKLYDLLSPEVFRFCAYLCGKQHLADDLCQQTFFKAIESLQNIKEPARFKSWLMTTANRLFIDFTRRPVNQLVADIEDMESQGDFGNQEYVTELTTILYTLPPEDRALVVLIYRDGYTYPEAAEFLGVTERAVRWRLDKASKILDKLVK